jgi:hypothetical protein
LLTSYGHIGDDLFIFFSGTSFFGRPRYFMP